MAEADKIGSSELNKKPLKFIDQELTGAPISLGQIGAGAVFENVIFSGLVSFAGVSLEEATFQNVSAGQKSPIILMIGTNVSKEAMLVPLLKMRLGGNVPIITNAAELYDAKREGRLEGYENQIVDYLDEAKSALEKKRGIEEQHLSGEHLPPGAVDRVGRMDKAIAQLAASLEVMDGRLPPAAGNRSMFA